eukprot:946959-Karenia_brevis.AAC.1
MAAPPPHGAHVASSTQEAENVANVTQDEAQQQGGAQGGETRRVTPQYPREVNSNTFGYETLVNQSLEKILQLAERDEGITAFP